VYSPGYLLTSHAMKYSGTYPGGGRTGCKRLTWAVILCASLVLGMHPVFLETNMRAAWTALLDEGQGYDGAEELLRVMMEDCHSSDKEGFWGRPCDRAVYLEGVLKQAVAATASRRYDGDVHDQDLQQVTDIPEAPENLSFSSFFLEYAVPGLPVVLLEDLVRSTGGNVTDVDTGTPAVENLGDPNGTTSSSSDHSVFSSSPYFDLDHTLELLRLCTPYTSVGMATSESLIKCDESLLEKLAAPSYAKANFAQRYQAADVLPGSGTQVLQDYLSRWTTVHRAKPGTSIPITTCPVGASMIVGVLSGSLDAKVYIKGIMPSLRPSFS
ncbi:unnamed protein product, partial [Discosporangium mesarthrocarpum]